MKIKNSEIWNDVNGHPIHAHGGCMIWYESFYYWYGEDRREDNYVSYQYYSEFEWKPNDKGSGTIRFYK